MEEHAAGKKYVWVLHVIKLYISALLSLHFSPTFVPIPSIRSSSFVRYLTSTPYSHRTGTTPCNPNHPAYFSFLMHQRAQSRSIRRSLFRTRTRTTNKMLKIPKRPSAHSQSVDL